MHRLLLLALALATTLVALEPAPTIAAANRAVPGGSVISHPARDSTHICTSGFNATRGGRSFVITAGHCGPVGWDWHRYSTGRRFGTESARRHNLSNGLDWAVIRSNGTHALPAKVRDRGRLKRVSGVARVRRGMRVCLHRGWSGGTACGRLTGVGPRMVTSGIRAQRGDSGSPLFHRRRNGSVTAVGILSSRSDGRTTYQRITVPLRQASMRLKTS